MKNIRTKLLTAVSVLVCLLMLFGAAARADRIKVSYEGKDTSSNCPQEEGKAAVVQIGITEAIRARDNDTVRDIRGNSGFKEGDSLSANSMYLICNGIHVWMNHSEATFITEDDGFGNKITKFDPVTITNYNRDAIDTIPNIETTPVWCNLYIPEANSLCVWNFPNGMLIDRVKPVITGTNLVTYPMLGFEDGTVYWNWQFADTGTPPDPDGPNGTSCGGCNPTGKWCCNMTDTRYAWQMFRRNFGETYPEESVSSTSGDLNYIMDTGPTTDKDRFISSPDTFCYVLRIQDSAGNWNVEKSEINSDEDTISKEKCFRPDGKDPEVISIDFFTNYDSGAGIFSGQFPVDYLGNPIVTSNACQFSPDCDISADRYIELKITTNEPLFDGVNHYGYTIIAGDGFDNDNNGQVDEEAGGFNNADDDTDGMIDDDVAYSTTTYPIALNDRKDNDADGYVDEHPGSLAGADSTSRFCGVNQLFNRAQTVGTSDVCFTVPLLYIDGIDSEGKVNGAKIEWLCTNDGVTVHPACDPLDFGQSVYRYRWRVGKGSGDVPPVGLEEGFFDITLSATDGVGNQVTKIEPLSGSPVWVDNTPPNVEVDYFADPALISKFNVTDHDNKTDTPEMSIIPRQTMYFSLLLTESGETEYAGATPEVFIFLPSETDPPYNGIPQQGVFATPTVYPACGQAAGCDLATGLNCITYDPETNPCNVFRGAFTIDSSVNDGFAAMTVSVKDRYSNRKWHATTSQALADQHDTDKKSDDTGLDGLPDTSDPYENDGVPTFVLVSATSTTSIEPDIALSNGQYFAIDKTPPEIPTISFPIAPCNNQVARDNMSCSTSMRTVSNPTLKWTSLDNGMNDDLDGATDEECIDGADGDSDGTTDEDGKVCNLTGSQSWEIARWRLQVSTNPLFNPSSLVKNTIVSGVSEQMGVLAERPITEPYYWRVAAIDTAGNVGPYNPQPPLAATDTPYFTFAVDITPPKFSVQYFTDADCSIPIAISPNGTPVTGDTASDPDKLLCMTVTTSEDIPWATVTAAMPSLKTYQSGFLVQSTTTVPVPSDSTTSFQAIIEIDAKGAGQQYLEGLVEVRLSSQDPYGNKAEDTLPASGSVFFVESSAPVCTFEKPSPDPASMDNNHNGVEGELDPTPTGDAVSISFTCNKYIGDSVHIRIKQNNFTPSGSNDDLLDNDCDGLIDEDPSDTPPDPGTGGTPVPGSGCWATATYKADTSFTYSSYYNVVPEKFDGTANVYLGDTNSSSIYFLQDMIGNPIYAETSFTVDTEGPAQPSLSSPLHQAIVKKTLPQFRWTIDSRASDLSRYIVEIATSSANFRDEIYSAYAELQDDGVSTSFFYTLKQTDISECLGYNPVSECPGLSDNTYYWRVTSVDSANNFSKPSITYTFTVDTQPPGLPIFNAVTTPTTKSTSPLSGKTNPPEPNAKVNIYTIDSLGRQTYAGTVNTDASGNFPVGIDDDGDGFTDEDPVDGRDNDADNQTDEDPPGIFLKEGKNYIEGLIIDQGGNMGTQGCSPATPAPFYDASEGKCIIVRDSGAPTFDLVYYSDQALTNPLTVIDNDAYLQTASATTVYMYIASTDQLLKDGAPNPPTFTVDLQGTTDISTTNTTSLNASGTLFLGQFTVNPQDPPLYVDGIARIVVIGTDERGNTTEVGTLPNSGGYLFIDTQTPAFRITYWNDSLLQEPLPKDKNLLPAVKAGSVFLRITPSEKLSSPPTININQPGSSDVSSAATTAADSAGLVFKYEYPVTAADGSTYIDGTAAVSLNAVDMAGNTLTAGSPDQGAQFAIDTTPPRPPDLTLADDETLYTQVLVSGSVKDSFNNAESFADVEIYVKKKITMTPDDGIDNDGDNRIDEEPGGMDEGNDNDNDLFVDEDISSSPCDAGNIWDASDSACIPAVSYIPLPNGTARTNSTGGFTTNVSGLMPGVNYLYARATDMAGNTSAFSSGTPLVGIFTDSIVLEHTFGPGWNMVGVPLQPSISVPSAALGIGNTRVFQLKNGVYVYSVGLDPIAPGMCYWIYFSSETTVKSRGVNSTTNRVRLAEGWNLVSIPYELPAPWDSTMRVSSTRGSFQVGTSDADELIEPYLYTYNGNFDPAGYNSPVGISDGYLMQPWIGFAIKAKENCWLVFPSRFEMEAEKRR